MPLGHSLENRGILDICTIGSMYTIQKKKKKTTTQKWVCLLQCIIWPGFNVILTSNSQMYSSLCVQLHFYCYCFSKGKILDFAQLTTIWLMPKASCYLLSIYLNLFIWWLEIPLCYLSDALLILFTSRDLTRLKTEFSERFNISDKIDLRIINNLTWTHLFIDMRLYIRQWNF